MKKRILSVALVLCLAGLLACGTLAYFQDRQTTRNVFTLTGQTSGDAPSPSDLFSIKLYETDENGNETTQGLEYERFLPGDVLDKDPTVVCTGEYSAWVRVHVTLTDAAAWKTACEKHGITKLDAIFGGYDESKWTRYDAPVYDEDEDTLTYTFYLNEAMDQGDEATLFDTVTIPAPFDSEDMASLHRFRILVTADAIQEANTGATAYEAFRLWVDGTSHS